MGMTWETGRALERESGGWSSCNGFVPLYTWLWASHLCFLRFHVLPDQMMGLAFSDYSARPSDRDLGSNKRFWGTRDTKQVYETWSGEVEAGERSLDKLPTSVAPRDIVRIKWALQMIR